MPVFWLKRTVTKLVRLFKDGIDPVKSLLSNLSSCKRGILVKEGNDVKLFWPKDSVVNLGHSVFPVKVVIPLLIHLKLFKLVKGEILTLPASWGELVPQSILVMTPMPCWETGDINIKIFIKERMYD